MAVCNGRRLFLTANASLGLGPHGMRGGDVVCVLSGGEVPFVLRPMAGGYFVLVGECYVGGLMEGEAIECARTGNELVGNTGMREKGVKLEECWVELR